MLLKVTTDNGSGFPNTVPISSSDELSEIRRELVLCLEIVLAQKPAIITADYVSAVLQWFDKNQFGSYRIQQDVIDSDDERPCFDTWILLP